MMLEIPKTGSLSCELVPSPPHRTGQLEYDFWIGPKNPVGEARLVRVAYSLAGQPINVIESHARPPGDPRSMRVASADFSIAANTFGMVSLMALDAAPGKFRPWSATESSRDMTAPEIEKARTLALWLWPYRTRSSSRLPVTRAPD